MNKIDCNQPDDDPNPAKRYNEKIISNSLQALLSFFVVRSDGKKRKYRRSSQYNGDDGGKFINNGLLESI